ncbi:MAG: LON peptidase substrate-binding domain-containing protein [bacterium]
MKKKLGWKIGFFSLIFTMNAQANIASYYVGTKSLVPPFPCCCDYFYIQPCYNCVKYFVDNPIIPMSLQDQDTLRIPLLTTNSDVYYPCTRAFSRATDGHQSQMAVEIYSSNSRVGIVTVNSSPNGEEELYNVGTAGFIETLIDGDTVQFFCKPDWRMRIVSLLPGDSAKIIRLTEFYSDSAQAESLFTELLYYFKLFVYTTDYFTEEFKDGNYGMAEEIENLNTLSDWVASNVNFDLSTKQSFLEILCVNDRANAVTKGLKENFPIWQPTNVYTGTSLGDYCRALAIGDGNNDGVNELYGTGDRDRVYQGKKVSGNWATTDLTGDIGDDMNGIAVGDVDTSFAGNEIYVGGDDSRLQQIKWNGSSWSTTVVTTFGDNIKQVSIGDGNNDGISEVYCASLNNHAYQVKKNGSSWTTTDLTGDCGDDMYAVAVGDADSTFTGNEVYAGTKDGTSTNGRLYEITYTNGVWTKTTIADLGSHINWISVGDGNNDEKGEVYVACEDVHIYQFRKTNGSWVKTDVGIGQTGTAANMFQVVVGDGNNDGYNEVFGVSRAIGTGDVGYVYQFKYNGSSWDKIETSLSANRGYFAVALGNADPDFNGNEVYGACDWTAAPEQLPHIYEFCCLGGDSYSAMGYGGSHSKIIPALAKDCVFEIWSKNPSRPNETTLKYSVIRELQVKVTLYDASGRLVKTLLNETVKSGSHTLAFDSKNLANGIYLIRLETGEFKVTKKLVIMR